MLGKLSEEELKELGPLGALLMAAVSCSDDHVRVTATAEDETKVIEYIKQHGKDHPAMRTVDPAITKAFVALVVSQANFAATPGTREDMKTRSKERQVVTDDFLKILHDKMESGNVTNTDLIYGSFAEDILNAFDKFMRHLTGASFADVIGRKPEKDEDGRWTVCILGE